MERIPLKDNPTGRGLMLLTLTLLALGVVMVHSALASVAEPGEWYVRVDIRHTIFAALAMIVMLLTWRIDYHWLNKGRRMPYLAGAMLAVAIVLSVIVLLRVPGIAHNMGGKWRWIRIGPPALRIGFQPSELIKVGLVIFLAAWLTSETVNVRSFWKTFLPAALLTGLCAALVIKNDFGSAGVIALAAMATMILAGVPWYHLTAMILPAAAGVYKYVVLDPDRWLRIQAMLDPWSQENPSAFQPRQSLLAIIQGGWFGRGPGNGMLKLGYLPEDSTDFIFAVYCEEWGFAGAMLLIGLWMMWMFLVRRAAKRAPDRFGYVLAGSLGFVIAVQAVLHIAVDLVAAPPTGMSLPFISAGGTALVVTAAAAAAIVSVSALRSDDPLAS
ncbi:MAG TPA: hypothetical protein DCX07_05490 [Phycisphaerales bacterium]|nr:hypothetical protein [Phycisphaerales bacterium]